MQGMIEPGSEGLSIVLGLFYVLLLPPAWL